MTYFEMFNQVNGMEADAIREKYDVDKNDILKFLFVEMKEEVVTMDVKTLFPTAKKTTTRKSTPKGEKKEMTPEQKAKKTVYGRLFSAAKKEIKELKDKGDKLSEVQEKEIKDKHMSKMDAEVKKELANSK